MASDRTVSATQPLIRIILPTSRFTASDERAFCVGDEYFCRWRRTRFVFEINALTLETTVFKTHVLASATRTQSKLSLRETTPSYLRLASTIYVEIITYSYFSEMDAI